MQLFLYKLLSQFRQRIAVKWIIANYFVFDSTKIFLFWMHLSENQNVIQTMLIQINFISE